MRYMSPMLLFLLETASSVNVWKCQLSGIENPRVGGSIPSLATNQNQQLSPVHVTGLCFF
ncbi:hypothetical protein THIX_90667 [Thiomonas sp. X19]|nr:hypothetical protein THIX_90667 [Thiomonas sp. X19]